MEILQLLPKDLIYIIIDFLPPATHKFYFINMPMVFYNIKDNSYVCFDMNDQDSTIREKIYNLYRLNKNIKLDKKDWELVYTPWFRNKKHDEIISRTYGELPSSIIYNIYVYLIHKKHLINNLIIIILYIFHINLLLFIVYISFV